METAARFKKRAKKYRDLDDEERTGYYEKAAALKEKLAEAYAKEDKSLIKSLQKEYKELQKTKKIKIYFLEDETPSSRNTFTIYGSSSTNFILLNFYGMPMKLFHYFYYLAALRAALTCRFQKRHDFQTFRYRNI